MRPHRIDLGPNATSKGIENLLDSYKGNSRKNIPASTHSQISGEELRNYLFFSEFSSTK